MEGRAGGRIARRILVLALLVQLDQRDAVAVTAWRWGMCRCCHDAVATAEVALHLRGGDGDGGVALGKRVQRPSGVTEDEKKRRGSSAMAVLSRELAGNSTGEGAAAWLRSFAEAQEDSARSKEEDSDERLQRLIAAQAAALREADLAHLGGDSETTVSSAGSRCPSSSHPPPENEPSPPSNLEGADEAILDDGPSNTPSGSLGWLDEVVDVDGVAAGGDGRNKTVPQDRGAAADELAQAAGESGEGAGEFAQFMGSPTMEMWLGASGDGNVRLLRAMHAAEPCALKWVDEDGRAALHLASACPKGAKAVKWLLAHGAEVERRDVKGRAALHYAAAGGYHWIVELLVQGGCGVDAVDAKNRTALMVACWHGSLKTAMVLLGMRADASRRDQFLCTPLHIASWRGFDLIVAQVLAATAVTPAQKEGGRGAEEGGEEARILGGVDARDDGGGTALHKACLNGHVAVVQRLLRHGADACAADRNGCSGLHLAAARGHADVVAALLKAGAAVAAVDAAGKTPFHWAAARGQVSAGQALYGGGADPASRDLLHQTPLHLSAEAGHAGMVDFLLAECGVPVDACDYFNNTALHGAARCGRGAVVELLLREGCALEPADVSGWSPLHWALHHNHSAVGATLRERGCSIAGEAYSPDMLPDLNGMRDDAAPRLARVARAGHHHLQRHGQRTEAGGPAVLGAGGELPFGADLPSQLQSPASWSSRAWAGSG